MSVNELAIWSSERYNIDNKRNAIPVPILAISSAKKWVEKYLFREDRLFISV